MERGRGILGFFCVLYCPSRKCFVEAPVLYHRSFSFFFGGLQKLWKTHIPANRLMDDLMDDVVAQTWRCRARKSLSACLAQAVRVVSWEMSH